MLRRRDIQAYINILRSMGYSQFTVGYGSAQVMKGVKAFTKDVDVEMLPVEFALLSKGMEIKVAQSGCKMISIGDMDVHEVDTLPFAIDNVEV